MTNPGLGERRAVADDPRPPMRSFVALLTLLLALPGLLLPAGALWHLCGCTERGLPAQSCCVRADASRASADPEASKPQRSCCAAKAKTGDETPQLVADDCGCEWLPIADEQPVRNTPESPPLLLALPPKPCFEPRTALVASSRCVQAWSPTASRPPPPDAQRSLPLRL